MNAIDLLDLVGQVQDTHIQDAHSKKSPLLPRWARRTAGVAASLVLVFGLGLLLFGMGGKSGGGSDGDRSYMYYTGPVLPLTTLGDSQDITAQRNVNYDFSPYLSVDEYYVNLDGEQEQYQTYRSQVAVTDRYTLTNASDQDRTLTLFYPFIGDLRSWEGYPAITAGGERVETSLRPGPYSGYFTGAWGSGNETEGSLNLAPLSTAEGYQRLLEDGSYLSSALDAFPALDQPVTVYRLHDFQYSAVTEDVNPSLSMEFYIDYGKTTVFSYDMNGASFDPESGYCARRKGAIEYRPQVAEDRQHPGDGYVILLGEDLEGYTIQGYRDMGCDPGEELEDLGCTVTRYETTLGEILAFLLEDYLGELFGIRQTLEGSAPEQSSQPSLDLYLGLTAELLYDHGLLGDSPAQRYDSGMLEDIFSAACNDSRVIYLSFELTIPAGEAVTLEASVTKEASIDYVGEDEGIDGYDLATTLGSALTFTGQTASLEHCQEVEIVSQNFGFDPAGGITQVELDLQQPFYWLQVRKVWPE